MRRSLLHVTLNRHLPLSLPFLLTTLFFLLCLSHFPTLHAFSNESKSQHSKSNPKNSKDVVTRRDVLSDSIRTIVTQQTFASSMDRLKNPNLNDYVRTASLSTLFADFVEPNKVFAIEPLTAKEAEEAPENKFDRMFRPKPPRILRTKLNQNFAVMLMRSSYNALDELDAVAMDQFQRDFFLLRQAEYEWYVNLVGAGSVRQGELSDPTYFDFISFAQYATISRELSKDVPKYFEEQQPDPTTVDENGLTNQFIKVIVRRDPDLEGKDLREEHSMRVGSAILDQLESTFQNTTSALPTFSLGSRPSYDEIMLSLRQLTNLFLLNGFALDGTVLMKDTSDGVSFEIKLASPANLWSGQALQFRKANPINCFILKVATVLLLRAGYTVKRSDVKYTKTEEITTITII